MKKIFDKLPMVINVIGGLVIVWLVLVFTIEIKIEATKSDTAIAKTNDDAGFATIKIDETTGCEYFVFRNIMTPRLDETGTKVRGCKETQ